MTGSLTLDSELCVNGWKNFDTSSENKCGKLVNICRKEVRIIDNHFHRCFLYLLNTILYPFFPLTILSLGFIFFFLFSFFSLSLAFSGEGRTLVSSKVMPAVADDGKGVNPGLEVCCGPRSRTSPIPVLERPLPHSIKRACLIDRVGQLLRE